jgi:hypothetical protein
MSQELQIGRYEFYPDDRLEQLIEELLFELRRRRLERRLLLEESYEELESGYRAMAAYEAGQPGLPRLDVLSLSQPRSRGFPEGYIAPSVYGGVRDRGFDC